MNSHAKNSDLEMNSSKEIKPAIVDCINRLEAFNTLFDIDTLFSIFNDLMDKCNHELNENYGEDAKDSLNKMYSMFWVIRDKLPQTLFEDIESITDFVKCQNNLHYKN